MEIKLLTNRFSIKDLETLSYFLRMKTRSHVLNFFVLEEVHSRYNIKDEYIKYQRSHYLTLYY